MISRQKYLLNPLEIQQNQSKNRGTCFHPPPGNSRKALYGKTAYQEKRKLKKP
jgi:hypothetical protein